MKDRWVPDITLDRLTLERGKDYETIDNLRKENEAMREAIRELILAVAVRGDFYTTVPTEKVDALAAFLDGMPAKIGKK